MKNKKNVLNFYFSKRELQSEMYFVLKTNQNTIKSIPCSFNPTPQEYNDIAIQLRLEMERQIKAFKEKLDYSGMKVQSQINKKSYIEDTGVYADRVYEITDEEEDFIYQEVIKKVQE